MARPPMKGLAYFPFDTAFFSDRRIKIVKARYGADGILLYLYLLCSVYREGYYLQADDDFRYILSADLGMSGCKIGQMLNYLLSRSLFDDRLFQSVKVLTSRGIQTRYQEAVKGRALKNPVAVDGRFWLLSDEETKPFIQVRPCGDISGKTRADSRNKIPDSEKNEAKKNREKEKKENKRTGEGGGAADAVAESYRANIGPLSRLAAEDIAAYRKKGFPDDLLVACLETAARAGKKNWNYVLGILRRLEAGGIKSRDEFLANRNGGAASAGASYDLEALDRFWDEVPRLD